tara:strand:- start:67 stop:414 length:348 start_codon:yes stop_codon:yes gene_type:complete
MMNFNMNIKDNNVVMSLLEGARLSSREVYKSLDNAKSEGRMVNYYNAKYTSASAMYNSLDYLWHKNHYASLKSYSSNDPISKAELAVDKAKTAAAKARYDHALAVYKEAYNEWMK